MHCPAVQTQKWLIVDLLSVLKAFQFSGKEYASYKTHTLYFIHMDFSSTSTLLASVTCSVFVMVFFHTFTSFQNQYISFLAYSYP